MRSDRAALLGDVAAALWLTAVSAVLWRTRVMAPVGTRIQPFGNADQYAQYYSLFRLAGRRWAAGEVPLWDPWQLAGSPLLARPQTGAFYPPNFLHVWLATERALEVLAFGHLVLGGACMYALVRTLGVRPGAALVGAGVYAWSTLVVGQHLWAPAIAAIAWLPLALTGVARIARDATVSGCIALAIGLSMPILTGYFPFAFYEVLAVSAYASWTVLRRLWARDAAGALRSAAWLAAGGVIAVLISALQWIPTLELVRAATRNTGGLTRTQLEPFGPFALAHWRSLFQPSERSYGAVAVLALLLWPVTLIARRHRAEGLFFLVLSCTGVLIALGSATPVFDLYLALPGAKLFRGPARLLCFFVLGTAVAAALGADNLFARELASVRQRAAALVATIVLAGALIAAHIGYSPTSFVLAACAIAACLLVRPGWVPHTAIVLGAVLVLQLAALPANSESQVWRPGQLAVIGRLRGAYESLAARAGFGRVVVKRDSRHTIATAPRVASMYGLYVFEDYEGISVGRYADYASFLQHGQLYESRRDDYPYYGALDHTKSILHPRLLAAAGVQFFARVRSPRKDRPQLDIEPIEGALPRAYIVHGATKSRGAASTLLALSDEAFALRSEVMLESPPSWALRPPAAAGAGERVRIVSYEAEAVQLSVSMSRPGALVLLDLDFPGWTATVNGRPARIYNANYLFRAVLLPAGHHRVSFRYAPQSFRKAIAAGSAGALALAIVGIVGFRRRRPRPRP